MLNVMQSVLLPFALIPLLKFVSSPIIMGEFAISKKALFFLVMFGSALYSMNFVLLFEDTETWTMFKWFSIIFICFGYMWLQLIAIREPV